MRVERGPIGAMGQVLRRLGTDTQSGTGDAAAAQLRQAAWVARCVGRGAVAPLTGADVRALASTLRRQNLAKGAVVFVGGAPSAGVWIVRAGRLELTFGTGPRRTVLGVLRPGDVDGDVALLMEMAIPYSAHALNDSTVLFLTAADFEQLLQNRPGVARRWLSSVATRLAASQMRVLDLLGRPLPVQLAQLLLDEADDDGEVHLPQRTLAAMLGVHRPSLNKVLKEFEHAG